MEKKKCEFDTSKIVSMFLESEYFKEQYYLPPMLSDEELHSTSNDLDHLADEILYPFGEEFYLHIFRKPIYSYYANATNDKSEFFSIMNRMLEELKNGLELPDEKEWSNFFEKFDSIEEVVDSENDEKYEFWHDFFYKYDLPEFFARSNKLLGDIHDALWNKCSKANDEYHKEYDDEIQEKFRQEEATMEEQEKREYEDFLERQKYNPNLQC